MLVRHATYADCPAIARMQIESYRTAYADLMPPEYLASFSYEDQQQDWENWFRSNQDLLLVATGEEGQFVGYALARKLDSTEHPFDCELMALHVSASMTRQGAGRLLFSEVARQMHAQGCRSLTLWMLEGNPARGFYERLGGREQGEQYFEIPELKLRRREVGFVWPRIEDLFEGG